MRLPVAVALVLATLALLALTATAVPVPWKNCGASTDIIKVVSVDASAWPVTRGKPETLSVKLNLGKMIRGGTYEVKVTMGGLPLINHKGPLRELNITLPIPAGAFSKDFQFTVPSFIPAGTASAYVKLTDELGAEAICLNVDIPFRVAAGDAAELSLDELLAITPAVTAEEPDFSSAVAVPVPWKNCGQGRDIIRVDSVEATMWPVMRGKPEMISIRLNLAKAIQDGIYEIKFTFDGFPLVNRKGPLKELNISLPWPSGGWHHNFSFVVPSFLPAGVAAAHVRITDEHGAEAICGNIDVPFKMACEEAPFTLRPAELPISELSVPIPYTNCGQSTDKFTVTRAEASMWPPAIGTPLTIIFNGTLSQDILDGTYEIKVAVGGIPVTDQKGTISELAKSMGIPMPIRAGLYGFHQTVTIPAILPKGTLLDVWGQGFNQKGQRIACLDVKGKLQL